MDMKTNVENRVKWIKDILESTGARGIIYGNSGGKDCTLVGALCRMATENVLGVIMPCQSSANYGSDRTDAIAAGERFGIRQIEVDLTAVKEALVAAMGEHLEPADAADGAVRSALININPRLRMTTLYALGQARGYLVAGTGNLCEATVGYFTKWGDGAYDFDPIADMTVPEVYDMLRYLGAPANIVEKAPSAGLYPGQTDEVELGVTLCGHLGVPQRRGAFGKHAPPHRGDGRAHGAQEKASAAIRGQRVIGRSQLARSVRRARVRIE